MKNFSVPLLAIQKMIFMLLNKEYLDLKNKE